MNPFHFAEDVIASRLAHLTREGASPSLLGGDLESALSVLRSVANRLAYRLQQDAQLYNARSHVVQIYQVCDCNLRCAVMIGFCHSSIFVSDFLIFFYKRHLEDLWGLKLLMVLTRCP